MAKQNKTATSKKKRAPKKVIEHDPLSILEEPHNEGGTTAESATSKSEETSEAASKQSSNAIDLGCSLVISDVEASRCALLEMLQSGSDFIIDGAEIEQIDGAGLQLLATCILEAEKMHVAFKWRGASSALCNAASQLGLTEILQLNDICQAA